jgi:hypothetical protein
MHCCCGSWRPVSDSWQLEDGLGLVYCYVELGWWESPPLTAVGRMCSQDVTQIICMHSLLAPPHNLGVCGVTQLLRYEARERYQACLNWAAATEVLWHDQRLEEQHLG